MFTLTIPRRLTAEVETYRDAADLYRKFRDDSGEGASTFPHGTIRAGRLTVATVSYNGRVWEGEQLVYCPGSAGQDEGRPDIFNNGRESEWGSFGPNPHPAGSVEHTVFERGAEFARSCYVRRA